MKIETDDDELMPAMVGAVQTHGDLTNWHPHIHAIVSEGVFDKDNCFVPVPYIRHEQAIEIWRGKVFDIFYEAGLLDIEDIGSMMEWKHTGFSIDTSVRISADDHEAMTRLVQYIARCPFSLARMVKLSKSGQVFYRASHPDCIPFPKLGEEMELSPGMWRNYQVFDPLDFLASVTQHIPNRGEHQIRYYGWYSNKRRGMRAEEQPDLDDSVSEPLSGYQLKCRITWAALIKCVYEVDPLKCPKCGAEMKVIGFIEREQTDTIRKLLLKAGLWKKPAARAPPPPAAEPPAIVAEPSVDYDFFNKTCS
jgi:hypothetical protein